MDRTGSIASTGRTDRTDGTSGSAALQVQVLASLGEGAVGTVGAVGAVGTVGAAAAPAAATTPSVRTAVPPLPFGAHLTQERSQAGARFRVWAPHARHVAVIGDFNDWSATPLQREPGGEGNWAGFVPNVVRGDRYKYQIVTHDGRTLDKADPWALYAEAPPATASRVWDLDHDWGDAEWMRTRAQRQSMKSPISIYEVHLGSWQRSPEGRLLTYDEIGKRLAEYVTRMGFTHVELMPVAEHPFYGSWGYQVTGYFAPTARYGTPQDLMTLVDTLHRAGIGVILDWVPSHFPSDPHALAHFDGTPLYEHPDPRIGFHPQWNSLIFDYGRPQVREFLIRNALFWLEHYHFDGLRVDAVASMLYLDFAREPGQWVPNEYGGNQNLHAVRFLQELNTRVYDAHPDVHVIAEESSAWEGVSRPVYAGGLGFGMKWNMGWMNDTLRYIQRPHFFRDYHGDDIRFSIWYAFNENFLLPLSHDEVVYGKGSLITRQPGDEWQRFAGLRALFGYMWAHPGKKLLFMGGEFGQAREWHHETQLDWHLLERPMHAGLQRWVADLNRELRAKPALHEDDFGSDGFEWAASDTHQPTVLAFFRRASRGAAPVLVVCNFTAQPVRGWRIGVPDPSSGDGTWRETLNSDAHLYGGSGMGNLGGCKAQDVPCGGYPHSIVITVPPLAVVFFEGAGPQSDASGHPPGAPSRNTDARPLRRLS